MVYLYLFLLKRNNIIFIIDHCVQLAIDMLALINTVIARAKDNVITRLINRNLIGLILPLLDSHDINLRLLTLWILGNLGTSYFKDLVVRPTIINSIVKVSILCQ